MLFAMSFDFVNLMQDILSEPSISPALFRIWVTTGIAISRLDIETKSDAEPFNRPDGLLSFWTQARRRLM